MVIGDNMRQPESLLLTSETEDPWHFILAVRHLLSKRQEVIP